jgi:shikimate 5-dehydrogenase
MTKYTAATERTMYFIGVTTGSSSIMKVFPEWARHLGLNAVIKGIDFVPNDSPDKYVEAVQFIRDDPLSLGALVTTHKMNLLKAAKPLFGDLDEYAKTLHEISSISKRGNKLVGHAKDPISAGASFEAIVKEGYWKETSSTLCLLGSGGSSLALSLYLHNKKLAGLDVPEKVVVTARRESSLQEMRDVHAKIHFSIPIEYSLTPEPVDADRVVGLLPPGSMVVNATGLGKDRPGSPLTDAVLFPHKGIVWEFNYRGNLVFLDQANAQRQARNLNVVDGWVYFIHGWTRVIAEVFNVDIPSAGPAFETLSQIAIEATKGK